MEELPPGVEPAYKDIRDLPQEDVGPYLEQTFTRAEQEEHPDLDRFLVLGKKSRAVPAESVDAFLEGWLSGRPEPKRVEIAANFLAGYWNHETRVPEPLLATVVRQLDDLAERREISELLILACDAVYPPPSAALKQSIRQTFAGIAGRLQDPPLQRFAATALNRVLTS